MSRDTVEIANELLAENAALKAQLAELAKQEPDFYAVYGSKGNLHSHCGSIHLARSLAKDIGGTFEGIFTRAVPPAPVKLPDLSPLDRLAGKFLQRSVDSSGKVSKAYAECAHLLATEVKSIRAAGGGEADE